MSGNSDTIPLNVDIVNRRRTRAHGVKNKGYRLERNGRQGLEGKRERISVVWWR